MYVPSKIESGFEAIKEIHLLSILFVLLSKEHINI